MPLSIQDSVLRNNPAIARLQEILLGRAPVEHVANDAVVGRMEDFIEVLNVLFADVFAIYLKTKNCQWHVLSTDLTDSYATLDGQASEVLAMADPLAERICKLGGSPPTSIGMISRIQHVIDNDVKHVTLADMLAELRQDNKTLAACLRQVQAMRPDRNDVTIEVWIAETARRAEVPMGDYRAGTAT